MEDAKATFMSNIAATTALRVTKGLGDKTNRCFSYYEYVVDDGSKKNRRKGNRNRQRQRKRFGG